MTEQEYERLLNIQTVGAQHGFPSSHHYHRYEATPYEALDLLSEHYTLEADDVVVDFGSGKGRLPFYLAYRFQVHAIGVEMNPAFHEQAVVNWGDYAKKHRRKGDVEFTLAYAEEFVIPDRANRFYFFNPFSGAVFMKVVQNILDSAYAFPRAVDIILYYPSDGYIFFLNERTPFEWYQEVRLPLKNNYERFVVYRFDPSAFN